MGHSKKRRKNVAVAKEERDTLFPAAASALACGFIAATCLPILVPSPYWFLPGLVAGFVAALACLAPFEGVLTAAVGTFTGGTLALLTGNTGMSPQTVLPRVAMCAVAAAVVAAGLEWSMRHVGRRTVTVVGLALVLGMAVLGGAWSASASIPGNQATLVDELAGNAPSQPLTSDELVYLRYVKQVRDGEPYYESVGRALAQANKARTGQVLLDTPLSYRLPTLYVALAQLSGWGIVIAALLWGSGAIVSAFLLVRRFAPASLALTASALVVPYVVTSTGTWQILQAEAWAGASVLASFACLSWSRRAGGSSLPLMAAAAVFALLAAMLRELALPLLAVGLTATLLKRELRSAGMWVPWAVGLLLGLLGFGAHWGAASEVAATYPHVTDPNAAPLPWFHPDGRAFRAALVWVGFIASSRVTLGLLLTAAGVAGVLIGVRDRFMKWMLGIVILGSLGLFLVVGPSGKESFGVVPMYWADLFIPLLLACVPLALVPLLPAQGSLVATNLD